MGQLGGPNEDKLKNDDDLKNDEDLKNEDKLNIEDNLGSLEILINFLNFSLNFLM